jgi:hypothetical protein
MELWDNLLSSALLGTERSQPQLTADAPNLLRTIAADSPEHRLLTAAAVSAAYRRAGYIPPTAATPLDAPAPEETQPPCRPRSAYFLHVMLEEPHKDPELMLPEWLEIVGGKGKRVPHPYLPGLFDLSSQDKKNARLVAQVGRVMGARGRWLAAHNSKWDFLLSVTIEVEQHDLSPETAEIDEADAIESLNSEHPFFNPVGMTATVHLLSLCRHEWSRKLLELFLVKLLHEIERVTGFYGVREMTGLVPYLPPTTLPEVTGRLKVINDKKKSGLDDFIALLEFRRDMLQELANE